MEFSRYVDAHLTQIDGFIVQFLGGIAANLLRSGVVERPKKRRVLWGFQPNLSPSSLGNQEVLLLSRQAPQAFWILGSVSAFNQVEELD